MNNDVIEIGTEETLVVPEEGEMAQTQEEQTPLTYSAEAAAETETGESRPRSFFR